MFNKISYYRYRIGIFSVFFRIRVENMVRVMGHESSSGSPRSASGAARWHAVATCARGTPGSHTLGRVSGCRLRKAADVSRRLKAPSNERPEPLRLCAERSDARYRKAPMPDAKRRDVYVCHAGFVPRARSRGRPDGD